MSQFANAAKGLGNMTAPERHAIYGDLRRTLKISETEPMLPLPPDELRAWARRYAVLLVELIGSHPATRFAANAELLEQGLLTYGKPADDALLDEELMTGAAMHDAGLPGIYVHTFMNAAAPALAFKAARELLPPSSVAIIEERYTTAMLLRHGLAQEAALGLAGLKKPEQSGS
jgi:hypothetical protein